MLTFATPWACIMTMDDSGALFTLLTVRVLVSCHYCVVSAPTTSYDVELHDGDHPWSDTDGLLKGA